MSAKTKFIIKFGKILSLIIKFVFQKNVILCLFCKDELINYQFLLHKNQDIMEGERLYIFRLNFAKLRHLLFILLLKLIRHKVLIKCFN